MDFEFEYTNELRILNKPYKRFVVQQKIYTVHYEGFFRRREVKRTESWVTLDRWGNGDGFVTPLEFWSVQAARDFINWWPHRNRAL